MRRTGWPARGSGAGRRRATTPRSPWPPPASSFIPWCSGFDPYDRGVSGSRFGILRGIMDGYLCRFSRSTIGLKVAMALTGVIMFGYLVGHVTGNWLLFAGKEKINQYSAFLHHTPALLWGTRVVLLVSVLLHLWATVRFLALRKEARPVAYDAKRSHGSTFAARTMYWSGPVILLFIVYHILH